MPKSPLTAYWETVHGHVYPGNVYTTGGVPLPQADRDNVHAHFGFSAVTKPVPELGFPVKMTLSGQRQPVEESLEQGILQAIDAELFPLLAQYNRDFQAVTRRTRRGSAGTLGQPHEPNSPSNNWHRVALPTNITREARQERVHGFPGAKELLVQIQRVTWRHEQIEGYCRNNYSHHY